MLWEEIVTVSKQTGVEAQKILQESLQKAVLAAFSHSNAFHHIVFQGGTALRLFYGNPRFSEDLDFVLRSKSSTFRLSDYIVKLPSALEPQFPFLQSITVRPQKEDNILQRCVLTTTSDNPQQQVRLHIELAAVPSYQNTLKILAYPPLQPAVRVETLSEIFADKLLALGCRDYIKGRDLWDLYFLTTEHHLTPPWDLVWQKTKDYKTTASVVQLQLKKVRVQLEEEGNLLLSSELKRFLPPSQYRSYQELFPEMIATILHLLQSIKKGE